MEILENKKSCCGCYACYNACPVQAIKMQVNEEGFDYPVIDEKKCIQCGKCKKVCPVLNKPSNLLLELAYGCHVKEKEQHMSSSSGGIFSVLAKKILLDKGIVCGAAYDDKQTVCHRIIDREEELKFLKETKYVQSRIEDTYAKIKVSLDEGRTVLFSGTPCQVAGLKGYLGQEYDNLLSVDLICHGVPAPEVWKRYLNEIAEGEQVVKVTFRNKSEGMSNVTLDYHLENGSVIKEKYGESLYIKGFIQNLFIRSACLECHFKGVQRCSDITIGDFWSVKEYHPEIYNEYGVSAVIIHSEKGKKWFESIESDMSVVCATTDEIACWNECLLVSVEKNPKRDEFYTKWNDMNLKELLGQLTKEPVKKNRPKVFSKIKKVIQKMYR